MKVRQLGTALFEAPEILLKKQGYYTLDNDIFSLGVILHLLLFKKFPYLENNDLRARVSQGERVKVYNNNSFIEDLLQKMLAVDPEERIGF